MNLQEVLTPFASFVRGPLTQKVGKLEIRRLSCQSFWKIPRISGKVWYETHQYLTWLSKNQRNLLKTEKPVEVPIPPK
jgi:hypothetical protein